MIASRGRPSWSVALKGREKMQVYLYNNKTFKENGHGGVSA
jgi:hypothetical protein